MNKPYNLFIGRFQSPHKGHQAIFDTYLTKGEPILIAIRDVPVDENNPIPAIGVEYLWKKIYANNPLVKIMIIPDIASVNYGRGVGYNVREIEADPSIASISATAIRKYVSEKNDSWKQFVDKEIWIDLEMMLFFNNKKITE